MKVLLDTNVLMDVAVERQPFFDDSEQVLALVEQGLIEGYVSASTFSDIYYLVRKARGREAALSFLQRIFIFCRVALVNDAAISIALTANFPDFEDAVQYSTAIVNQLDAIVTRDPAGFIADAIQILTPAVLIQQFPDVAE